MDFGVPIEYESTDTFFSIASRFRYQLKYELKNTEPIDNTLRNVFYSHARGTKNA